MLSTYSSLKVFDVFVYPLIKLVLHIRGKDSQGEEVIKPYTPTTLDTDVGYFELVIKVHIMI